METIDQDVASDEMSDDKLQTEFSMLERLAKEPGFEVYLNTMKVELEKSMDALFSDERAVIDIATFFAREETFATCKTLRRYIKLVDERRAELHEQLETNQRKKEQV